VSIPAAGCTVPVSPSKRLLFSSFGIDAGPAVLRNKMNRRFLNLIARTATGTYSINRMNTSQLFNRSTAVIAKDGNDNQVRSIKEIPEHKSQRATTFCFQPFRSEPQHVTKGVVDVFSSFGQHKILYADRSGCTMVYGSKSHTVTGMPALPRDPCTRSSRPSPTLEVIDMNLIPTVAALI
jgi:hypothetical protein